MALNGSLGTMPLPELFDWLGRGRKTGILEVERDKVVKQLAVGRGRVVGCSSDDPPQLLGQFLLSQGRITEENLRDALSRQDTTREPLGEILVAMGLLTDDELSRHLVAKAEETIVSLFDWKEGEFRFDENQVAVARLVRVDLDVKEILRRGARRIEESRRVGTVFSDPGIVLRKTTRAAPVEIMRHRLASRIFESINGERSVAEIILHAHASEFLVKKFLFELFRSGLVEICGVRSIAPEAARSGLEDGRALEAAAACPAPRAAPTLSLDTSGPPAPARAAATVAGTKLKLNPSPAATATIHEISPANSIELARQLMDHGEFDAALDVLNALYREGPGDETLRRLVAEAEAAFVDKAYTHYVPATKVPNLARPIEALTSEDLSPAEFFLLSRIDGTWNVRSIVQIAPLREVDALRTLKRMREKGILSLRDPS